MAGYGAGDRVRDKLWKTVGLIAAVGLLQGCGGGDYETGDDPCTGRNPAQDGLPPSASDAEINASTEALQRSTYWMEHPRLSASDACAAAQAANRAKAATTAPLASQAQRPTAPALPPQQAANAEELATILNLNGRLCARVLSVSRLTVGGGRVFEVTCVEYRGGSATVNYRIDMRQNPPVIH